MNDHRVVVWAPLLGEDLRDRFFVQRVRTEAVDGLRRERNELPAPEARGRCAEGARVRGMDVLCALHARILTAAAAEPRFYRMASIGERREARIAG